MKLFFGKFSKNYPEQITKRFYAAGKEGCSWYGNIKPGDYVFPIYKGRINELWVAKEFTTEPNKINKEGSLLFELVNKVPEVTVSTQFLRNKQFVLDLNTINKSIKSAKRGFFEIQLESSIQDFTTIDVQDLRNIYISIEEPYENIKYTENDIRILVGSSNDYPIEKIQIYKNNTFVEYSALTELYSERNSKDERYSLQELLKYSIEDGATNKNKYLSAVLAGLNDMGFFKVVSPVALYDNIIVGRKVTRKSKSSHKELIKVVESEEIESDLPDNLEDYFPYVELLEDNPNIILYGPPGTGKTYAAQKIVEAVEYQKTGLYLPYDDIAEEERVEFITFHQSYSYEEFVEGIRPVFFDDEVNTDESSIEYKVSDGIIKRLANIVARSHVTKSLDDQIGSLVNKNSQVYKISLGQRNQKEEIYSACREGNYIAIGWIEDEDLSGWDYDQIYSRLDTTSDNSPTNNTNSVNTFVNEMGVGDIVLIYDSPTTIRDIVVVEDDYYHENDSKEYSHRRKVKWLKHFDEPFDVYELNGGVRLTMKTVYPLKRIQFTDIQEILNIQTDVKDSSKSSSQACYLIIDEINRGNISKIFGELITLLEKDKRDRLKITLPYSRKPFRLPSNIYLIGTMNTADRSIAILDTALRRRFTFAELVPDSSVIETSDSGIIEDEIELAKLLDAMNEKIEKLYDRDHRIGHSYLMDLNSVKQFRNTWEYKIIPLLMDYFYNDTSQVLQVVGNVLVDQTTGKSTVLEQDDFIKAVKAIYGK